MPESRHAALRIQLDLLHEMVEKQYDTRIDQQRALLPLGSEFPNHRKI